MATETTVTEVHAKALENRKQKIAGLKAQLKTLAVVQRRNYAEAVKNGVHYIDEDGKETHCWDKEREEQFITVLHIVYNRLRKRPPHMRDEEAYLAASTPDLWRVPDMYKQQAVKYGLTGCLCCPRRPEVTTPKLECDGGDCRENIPWFDEEVL
jgi:glycyl-tRNA synthetase (class II)